MLTYSSADPEDGLSGKICSNLLVMQWIEIITFSVLWSLLFKGFNARIKVYEGVSNLGYTCKKPR